MRVKYTTPFRYELIVFLTISLFLGAQAAYCSEGQLSLQAREHPEWLDKSIILIDGKKYTFDTLPEKLSDGPHTIQCCYEKWVFKKTVHIKPGQTNMVFVKFQEKSNALRGKVRGKIVLEEVPSNFLDRLSRPKMDSARITIDGEEYKYNQFPLHLSQGTYTVICTYNDKYFEKTFKVTPGQTTNIKVKWEQTASDDMKPGMEGQTRPGTVVITIHPPSAHDGATLWVESSDEIAPTTYNAKRLSLPVGSYRVYATAKGYLKSDTEFVTVPSGDFIDLSLSLEKDPHGILKISISPDSAAYKAKIHLKNLTTGKIEDYPYKESGRELIKGDYAVSVSARGYKTFVMQKVTVPSGEREVKISISLKRQTPWAVDF